MSSSPFGLSLQSGVATAYHFSPNRPVFNVRLLRTNFLISFFTTSRNLFLVFLFSSFPVIPFPSPFFLHSLGLKLIQPLCWITMSKVYWFMGDLRKLLSEFCYLNHCLQQHTAVPVGICNRIKCDQLVWMEQHYVSFNFINTMSTCWSGTACLIYDSRSVTLAK